VCTESYTNPANGQKQIRKLLGGCAHGKLLVARGKAGHLDLLWIGTGFNKCTLDDRLRQTVRTTSPKLALLDQHTVWLCRLPPGQYQTQADDKGGFEVWQLLDPQAEPTRRMILLRPGAHPSTGNISRAYRQRPAPQPATAATPPSISRPRLTRPAA
jgi:hypothetical protein